MPFKAAEISVETVRGDNYQSVYGPDEPNYGRQHFGWVGGDTGNFTAMGTDRNELGPFALKSEAVKAVVGWAEENLTSESVRRDFQTVTAGGYRINFLRRIVVDGDASILAVFDGSIQTSWGSDGICDLYRFPETEEDRAYDAALRLVPREPAPDHGIEDDTSPALSM